MPLPINFARTNLISTASLVSLPNFNLSEQKVRLRLKVHYEQLCKPNTEQASTEPILEQKNAKLNFFKFC
jgi:hypothetical protein